MEYRFGPNKPNFTGTDEEWNKLKQEIVWWNEDTSNYPSITVICPHCGAKNMHTTDGTITHRECDLMRNKKGKKIYYDCPGYYICRYINTSK
jgi:transposase